MSLTSSDRKTSRESAETILHKGAEKINYQEELTLVFFNSMLDVIIDEWTPLNTDQNEPTCICKNREECNTTKDCTETLSKLTPENSNVSLSKRKGSGKRRSSARSPSKRSSAKRKSSANVEKLSSIKEQTEDDLSWLIRVPEENVRIKFKNGAIYEGMISCKKKMHGLGKIIFSNGAVYEGEFSNGFRTGRGTLIYPDLSVYSGEFCNGILHGQGVMNLVSTPTIYSGFWKNGLMDGDGWMLYESGDWYDGEWFEDKRQGIGMRQYKNGDKYYGEWYRGKRHGKGTYLWTNNDIYRGEWVDDEMEKYGTYTWNATLNHALTFTIENSYEGNWLQGKMNGTGTMYFGHETGTKYIGTWENSVKNGPGVLTCSNGQVLECFFLDDKPVASLDKESSSINSRNKFKELITFPLHSPPHRINLLYFIEAAIKKFACCFLDQDNSNTISTFRANKLLAEEIDSELTTETENNPYVRTQSKLATLYFFQHQLEEKRMENLFVFYMEQLKALYNDYATLNHPAHPDFRPVLIRMYLWQLIIDLNLSRGKYSLVEIDEYVMENPTSGLESVHYPFEKIYFWQFLQILVTLSWITFKDDYEPLENHKKNGFLATIFETFLKEALFVNTTQKKDNIIFKYQDVLPMKSMYKLYKEIGEPHTARKFLSSICVKKNEEPPWYLKDLETENTSNVIKGRNSVAVNGNIFYLPEKPALGEPIDDQTKQIDEDPFRRSLYMLRNLKPKRVMTCLRMVCPQIEQEGLIVNADYPLTFMEFYQVLLHCTVQYLIIKKQHEILMMKKEQDLLNSKTKFEDVKLSRRKSKNK